MNAILNPDRTLKIVVSVNEFVARSIECPIDILLDDIFIENAPSIPEGMYAPQLSIDNSTWVETNQAAKDAEIISQSLKDIENAVDMHIETTAQAKGYNSTESCLSYIGDANVQWNAEAVAFKAWRSQCWEYVIAERIKIDSLQRTIPTPEEAVSEIELLFPMVWP